MLARWLAMNLEPMGDVFRMRLDISAIRALLADHFARDLWPVLEDPRERTRIDLVIGGASEVFPAEDVDRARAAASDRVHVHVIPNATHWVHADAPTELSAIWSAALRSAR
jgi:pimeloyl-ACP methyl ester carboxylesterase